MHLNNSFLTIRKPTILLTLLFAVVLMVYVFHVHEGCISKEKSATIHRQAPQQYLPFDDDKSSRRTKIENEEVRIEFPGEINPVIMPSVYDDDRKIMSEWKPLNSIPHILHVSWKSTDVPEFAYSNIAKWRKFHPDWKIVFWNDADIHRYVAAVLKNSVLHEFYKGVPKTIMRMDFSRYVILYTIGGVYADIDVTPLRSVTPLLPHHSCIIAREPEPFLNSMSIDGTVLASNFLMASRPGHPFMYFLMKKIAASRAQPETGPLGVNDALKEFFRVHPVSGRDGAVFLAPSLYFDPPHGKGDKIHFDMLNARCNNYQMHRSSRSAFTNRLCEVLKTERRIDFEAMYKHPKSMNYSFVWHRMFGSWTSPEAERSVTFKSLSTLPFKLSYPSDLIRSFDLMNPYERERKVLKLQYDP